MVFQNYALYPHMTVRENMEFPLKMAKMDESEIDEQVEQAAEILDLTEHLDRKPSNLSGGQRQRVAMGRAIVREPKVFLMDEPLSNLDAKLRVQMRAEISRIQNRLETTTVYVTHDQTEAMTLGDRVAVMRKGELQQVGSPQELYDHPVNLFVAGFIGSPSMNFMPVEISGRTAKLPICEVEISTETAKALESHSAKNLMVGIRPEHFEDSELVGDQPGPRFEVEVSILESMGSELYIYFDIEAGVRAEQLDELAADTGGESAAEEGQVVARLDATSKAKRGAKSSSGWTRASSTSSTSTRASGSPRATRSAAKPTAARRRQGRARSVSTATTAVGTRTRAAPASAERLTEAFDHVLAPVVGAEQHVAITGDSDVGVGFGAVADQAGLPQRFDDGDELVAEPGLGDLAAVAGLAKPLDQPEPPRFDRLGQLRVAARRFAEADPPALLGGQRHALGEEPFVSLRRQVGQAQLAVG